MTTPRWTCSPPPPRIRTDDILELNRKAFGLVIIDWEPSVLRKHSFFSSCMAKETSNRMEHFSTALRFSEWAIEMLSLPTLGVAFILSPISFGWATIKQRPFKIRLWKLYYWLVISHLLFFAAAIIVGVFGTNPITNPTILHSSIPAAEHFLDFVPYGSVVSCGFRIWQMKGFRWFAASLLLLVEVITWGAFVVAWISVSGDWL